MDDVKDVEYLKNCLVAGLLVWIHLKGWQQVDRISTLNSEPSVEGSDVVLDDPQTFNPPGEVAYLLNRSGYAALYNVDLTDIMVTSSDIARFPSKLAVDNPHQCG
jgi:hypothetical protein